MLTLNDGRAELWQWDTGRTLSVDADCSQVHFSNKVFGRSIDVDVVDGVAIIPDVLLQTDKDLNVWAFVGTDENGYTKISKTFKVNRRNKPADYVFTPVEQTTIAEIAAIAQSVRDDADAGLFDGKPGENGRDGIDGKDGQDGLPGKDGTSATHSWNGTVLTMTSASGTSSADLKGDKGDKGDKGEQGIPGPAGSDANVTAENIESALGYTPADSKDVSAKLDKPSTPPEVGKILKVTAVNEDGSFVCEWADAPSGGGAVDDVQIDGNSIVADGVANIPLCGNNTTGLVSGTLTYNVNVSTKGNLRAQQNTIEQYEVRDGQAFIGKGTLENIKYDLVKRALSDGNGVEWTDAERIAALLCMGCTVDDNGFVKWLTPEG